MPTGSGQASSAPTTGPGEPQAECFGISQAQDHQCTPTCGPQSALVSHMTTVEGDVRIAIEDHRKLYRWEAWLARLKDDLEEGRMYDAEEWRLDALSLTLNWAHSRKELPQEPQGDAAEVSQRLYSKYI